MRETLSSPSLNVATNSPDLNPVDYAISGGLMQQRVYHGRKYDTVDQLKQVIVLEWRAHCHGAPLITASVNGDVVCSVSWIRMADTLNIRFTVCNTFVKYVVLKYFLEYISTPFFAYS